MAVRIQIRRDTTQNWYEVNPVLSNGEIGIEFLENGKNKIKIGNGVDTYSDLEYFNDIISYNDLLGKPQINGIELVGNNTLADLGIQPVGSYASYEDVVNGLALKADIDNTYTKYEVDTFFNNLLKIPAIEGYNDKYLKLIDGEIIWSDITGDIVSVQLLNEELNKKVDKVEGYSLIPISELDRLSSVTNYDDSEIKEDIDLLKAEVDTKASINQLENYVSEDDLNSTLNNYALKSDISSKANASDLSSHVNNRLNPHNVTPSQIGLGNVNNTSDMNKPISVATQTALNAKQDALTTGYGISIENNVITNTVPNVQSDWNEIEGNAVILNKPNLSTVATSGSYNDLNDKPYIPDDYVLPIASETELGGIKVGQGLIKEADGKVSVEVYIRDYNDLEHKPSIGGVTLIEGQTAEDLDLASAKATQSELNLKADLDYVNDTFINKDELSNSLNLKADKATTLAGYNIEDAYTKAEIDAKIGSVYTFKGHAESIEYLPQEGNTIGDVYNVENTGANYAWDGYEWDKLSETIDLSLYVTKEEFDNKVSELETSIEDKTSKADLELKADKTELEDKADKTELSDYASMDILELAVTYLDAQIATKVNNEQVDALAVDMRTKVDETDYATDTKAGVVKIGSGLTITEDGVLSSPATSNNYEDLTDKPLVNSVELTGDKSLEDLGIASEESLNTLQTTFEETGLKTNQITNCLLENPQLVDLELVDGTLTLKAGSTVIVPYGIEAPTLSVGDSLNGGTISDISWDGSKLFYYITYNSEQSKATNTIDVTQCAYVLQGGSLYFTRLDRIVVSETEPTDSYNLWYDTTNNQIRYWTGSSYTNNYCSLPFAVFSTPSADVSLIDQVFQSIGYIGSTVWVGKGVKGLAPNGRKADGSLNNELHIIDSVRVGNPTYSDSSLAIVNIIKDGSDFNVVYDWISLYFEQETQPTNPIQYAIWFNTDENVIYQYIDGKWYPQNRFFIGKVDGSMNGLTYFKADTVSKIVNYSDTEFITHQSFPSERNISLTLGASETTYTATADGYVVLNVGTDSDRNTIQLYNETTLIGINVRVMLSGAAQCVFIPVRKNDVFRVVYEGTATLYEPYGFRFIYAEGAY